MTDDRDPQAVDAGQVDPRPVGQGLAHPELQMQLAAGAGQLAEFYLALDTFSQQRLEFGLALVQAVRNVVVHRQRLAQHEQVFLTPVARQRLGYVLLARLDAAVA